MNSSKAFWGLAIVFVGVFWLLGNFGLLPSNFWYEIWRLWPLLLIFWGVSLLFGKEGRGGVVLSVVFALILLAAVILFGWIYNSGKNFKNISSTISENLAENISNGELNFKFGATELSIDGSSSKFMEGQSETIAGLDISSHQSGTKQEVDINQTSKSMAFWGANSKNKIDLKLSNKIPLALKLDTGASKFDLDLTENKISSLEINCGASDGEIKIGSLYDEVKIDISSGASNFNLKVPRDSGLKIINKSGLSSDNLSSLGLIKDDKVWHSEGFDNAAKKIEITFSSGVSNLNIEKY